jgi:hypothetical protein
MEGAVKEFRERKIGNKKCAAEQKQIIQRPKTKRSNVHTINPSKKSTA